MDYFLLFIGLYLMILGFKAFLTVLPLKTKLLNVETIDFSQITIVQPIQSGDPTLEETLTYNLHANSEVNYLWLIDDSDTNAHDLTTMLQKDFEHINIKVVGYKDCPDRINPKVFKLNQGIKKVLTDYVIVLDDDAMLKSETLHDLIVNLKENDITTCLPVYKDNGNFWCKLTTQWVNNTSAMCHLPLLWFKKSSQVNGVCYAMKLVNIQKLSYFEKMLTSLADDVALSAMMKEKGMPVYQSREHVILQNNIADKFGYTTTMHRWFLFNTLFFKNNTVKENIVNTILHILPPLFLWMIVLYGVRDLHFIVLPLILVARLGLIKLVQKEVFKDNHLYQYGFSLLSELMEPYYWFQAFVRRTIVWRTHIYRVENNEKFIEV